MAKRFAQKLGVDFSKIFSPVVRYITIRIIFSLTAHFDWELEVVGVKITFLHSVLDREIYMAQLEGFCKFGAKVCIL